MKINQTPRQIRSPRAQRLSHTAEQVTLGDSFVKTHSDSIVGIAGLTGMVGSGVLVGTQLTGRFEGLAGMLVGIAAGAGAGTVAGLAAGEAFLHLYPLDPANEKEKYTALARGAAGMVGAMIGGIAGGVAGYCGAEPFSVAASSVLGGAVSAGATEAALSVFSK